MEGLELEPGVIRGFPSARWPSPPYWEWRLIPSCWSRSPEGQAHAGSVPFKCVFSLLPALGPLPQRGVWFKGYWPQVYLKAKDIQYWVWLQVKNSLKKYRWGTSLVVQWLRILLPMQGTWVQALVWEDPTCHGAAKPVCHNYWACALEPVSHNYWAHMPQLLKPVHPRARASQQEKTLQWEGCAPQWRGDPTHRN